jgi:hypothetical protein
MSLYIFITGGFCISFISIIYKPVTYPDSRLTGRQNVIFFSLYKQQLILVNHEPTLALSEIKESDKLSGIVIQYRR